jgi:hypothetical protein
MTGMDDGPDYVEKFANAALEWIDERNKAWIDDKGYDAMYYVNHDDGRLYFYKDRSGYPDRPYVWYAYQSIGTWAPSDQSFMWACANSSVHEPSRDISERAMKWIGSKTGVSPGNGLVTGVSPEGVKRIVAIAARLAGVVAVYRATTYLRDAKDEMKALGGRVTLFNRNKVLHHEFLAITTFKNAIA